VVRRCVLSRNLVEEETLDHGGWGCCCAKKNVAIVTRIMAGRAGFRIPVGTRDTSVFQNAQTGCVQHSLLEQGRAPAYDRLENFTALLYFTL
jgi:hypothetical protein